MYAPHKSVSSSFQSSSSSSSSSELNSIFPGASASQKQSNQINQNDKSNSMGCKERESFDPFLGICVL